MNKNHCITSQIAKNTMEGHYDQNINTNEKRIA